MVPKYNISPWSHIFDMLSLSNPTKWSSKTYQAILKREEDLTDASCDKT